ncbi:MAG: Rieske 2Fe-2S domain-containing protein [Eubacteriales bacterium]|nr:Rieske 2Fe-2S domain-containing protein [Eubacteriales bacterium]
MGYVKVAEVDALQPGEKKVFPVQGKTILLVNLDGEFFALDNKCPHLGGSLVEGNLDGATLSCPRHGARFDVRSGKNVGSAKIAFIQMKVADAKKFPVKIEGKDILVELA